MVWQVHSKSLLKRDTLKKMLKNQLMSIKNIKNVSGIVFLIIVILKSKSFSLSLNIFDYSSELF